MKRLITLFVCVLICGNLSAQQRGAIQGNVLDENKEPLIGAVVQVSPVEDPEKTSTVSTGQGGSFNVTNLAYGSYNLRITFLGYKPLTDTVQVNGARISLGQIGLELDAERIEDIVLEIQAMRTSLRGDTVTYNAEAFKVAADADAETLLSKMPGITVVDGQVEAQGETVKKVFVDGREHFGEDVNMTIKNLPAEVISQIEVYNKLSDQAEFSGIDDGEGYKAINIVTTVNRGQYGKLFAGYGFNDKYTVGGNVNFVKGTQRVTVIGLANNMNQQNFGTEDILGVTGGGGGMNFRGGRMREGGGMSSGRSTSQNFAINFSDAWGKKNNVEVSANYTFGRRQREVTTETDRQYYSSTDITRLYEAFAESNNQNLEHRFNGRIYWKINDANQLMIRPRVSFQNYNSYNFNEGTNSELGNNGVEDLLNTFENLTDPSKNTGYNLGTSIIYRARLGKPGRTMILDLSGSMNDNDRKSISQTLTMVPTLPDSLFRQHSFSNSSGYNLSGTVIYTEPVSQNSQVSVQYRASYNYSDIDRKAYLWDEILQAFNPDFSDEYSNIYNSGYLIHRVGPGFNYSKNRNTVSANVFYQRSSLTGNQDFPTTAQPKITADFNDITYFMMINKYFNSTNTLRVHTNSSTSNPSVTQLQDVIDMSNSQFVTSGNSELKPTYNHNLFANYVRSSITKGRTFMVMGGYTIQSNYIANDIVLLQGNETYPLPNGETLTNGAQYTRPVNMSGMWSINGMVSYGTPVKFIKSNVNFNLGVMYSKTPSIINGVKNYNKGQYYNGGVTIGSNISEKIDFTLSYNGGYNISKNTFHTNSDNKSIVQTASAKFKVELFWGITFSGNGNFYTNHGITDDYTENYFICDLYIGKKIFKSRRGEITFGVNDLLNENKSFARNITSTYIENVRTNTIDRYWGFQFVYNLRNYGGSTGQRPGGNFRGPDGGGRPMGPPPGRGGFGNGVS